MAPLLQRAQAAYHWGCGAGNPRSSQEKGKALLVLRRREHAAVPKGDDHRFDMDHCPPFYGQVVSAFLIVVDCRKRIRCLGEMFEGVSSWLFVVVPVSMKSE